MVGERDRAARRRGRRADSARLASTTAADGEPAARYVAINGNIPRRDRQKLQYLSRHTRVPQSEYLREAIRDLLRKYREVFEGTPFEDDVDQPL